MGKIAIALRGRGNSGKTYTIVKVYELLKSKYKEAVLEYYRSKVDITVIININGKRIGIESQGDPGDRLKESLKMFIEEQCAVIVCDTRTRGQTCETVQKLRKFGYEIKWFKQNYVQPNKRDENNLEMAKIIVREVQAAIATD